MTYQEYVQAARAIVQADQHVKNLESEIESLRIVLEEGRQKLQQIKKENQIPTGIAFELGDGPYVYVLTPGLGVQEYPTAANYFEN